ncbi:MAG: IclR family transcriptional regulator [Deltaproteobacteria bacterium]|nr:IclR family transcriptional regulator [Deltaproteobacteria bacterium]
MKSDGVVVLERALGILQWIAARRDAGLAEIAQGTGLGKSTVLRLIGCLETTGLLARQSDTQRYHVGPRVLEYSFAASRGNTLITVVHPHMVALEEDLAETVALHVRVGDRRLCIAEVESRTPLRYVHGVGSSGPLYAGAVGKVILANQEPAEQKDLLRRVSLQPITSSAPLHLQELEAELAVVRTRGFALSRGEVVAGAVSVATPVFDRRGDLVAAMSVTGLGERVPEERLGSVVGRLRDAAAAASRTLGHQSQFVC